MWILILVLVLISDIFAAWATIEWFQKKNLKKAIILYTATVLTLILAIAVAYVTWRTQFSTHT